MRRTERSVKKERFGVAAELKEVFVPFEHPKGAAPTPYPIVSCENITDFKVSQTKSRSLGSL